MLSVLDELFVLSGLNVNKAKEMFILFAKQFDGSELSFKVGIKWRTTFT